MFYDLEEMFSQCKNMYIKYKLMCYYVSLICQYVTSIHQRNIFFISQIYSFSQCKINLVRDMINFAGNVADFFSATARFSS